MTPRQSEWLPRFRRNMLFSKRQEPLTQRLSYFRRHEFLEPPRPAYTVRTKSFKTDFIKNRRHMRKTHTFCNKNKINLHIYRLLRGRTVSEKVFGPSLIHQLRLLGSQQHPQSGVLLTSFSTLGTENSLVGINLESRGRVIKCCNIFWGSKIGKHLQLCGRAHYRATRKNLDSRTQLDETVECASGGDPSILYKILYLLFFPVVRILCALRLESRKKFINIAWMRDLWNFNYFGRREVSPTNSELCRFVSGS